MTANDKLLKILSELHGSGVVFEFITWNKAIKTPHFNIDDVYYRIPEIIEVEGWVIELMKEITKKSGHYRLYELRTTLHYPTSFYQIRVKVNTSHFNYEYLNNHHIEYKFTNNDYRLLAALTIYRDLRKVVNK